MAKGVPFIFEKWEILILFVIRRYVKERRLVKEPEGYEPFKVEVPYRLISRHRNWHRWLRLWVRSCSSDYILRNMMP